MKVWIKANGHWCNEEDLGGKNTLAIISDDDKVNGYCTLMEADELEFNNTGHTTVTHVKSCLTGSNNCYFKGNPKALFELDRPFLVDSKTIKIKQKDAEIEGEVYYKKDLIKLLGASGKSLDRWSESGKMPKPFMMIGRLCWLRQDIEKFLEDQQKIKE